MDSWKIGGDCSVCRREKYCHSQCRENKKRVAFIARQAYEEKITEIMAKNYKDENHEEIGQVLQEKRTASDEKLGTGSNV